MSKVIGLCGELGSGKSEVARILNEDHGFVRVKMTDPLNAMLMALGIDASELDGPSREEPHPLLCGKSVRHAQQTLGTEWGRDLISQYLWTFLWSRNVCDVLEVGGDVVCENIRFPSEMETLTAVGGELWEVCRPGLDGPQHAHVSEQHREFRADAARIIHNNGTLESLRENVSGVYAEFAE